jgi:hypothetical protein
MSNDRHQQRKKLLYDLLAEAKDVNNVYEPSRWGAIRVIQNRQVLIMENSLRCVLSWTAEEAGYWAYHAARDYAEWYEPHYGTGLIPESAPRVKAIVGFWCEYYGVEIWARIPYAVGGGRLTRLSKKAAPEKRAIENKGLFSQKFA